MQTPTSMSPAQAAPAAVRRKLIEVSLPLEDINRESVKDGPKRKNHPWRMHYWWARRKLPATRAVLFAQLVDDPSSFPDTFPTEDEQRAERERLHAIVRRLVAWEAGTDDLVWHEAREEIAKSTGGDPPVILDPFAGGGSIPLEAQRLGVQTHASDLNPVAVLINKALIEIPPKFAARPPVFPDAAETRIGEWARASGLAEDVRRYGAWMRDRAQERIGHLYPKATVPSGENAPVIAWMWARTVTCPNPACGIQMPLVRSWWLGTKKGKEAYVVPTVVTDADAPSGRRVAFSIGHDLTGAPSKEFDGTVGRTGGTCIGCGTAVSLKYIRLEGKAHRMQASLMAMVAEGQRQRVYLAPTEGHASAAAIAQPEDVPSGDLPKNPRDFKTPNYGMTQWADLFTNRQLTALTTFSDLVGEAREQILVDARAAGHPEGTRLADGGTDAAAYADAVATYLGMGVSRSADYMSSITTWHYRNEQIRNVFARQAIPMAWDFLEVNPLGTGSGTWQSQVRLASEALEGVPSTSPAIVTQQAAQSANYAARLISTDPPYYDNVGYSDLSDFFYTWLRRSIRTIHPSLFSTVLVPKTEELVANPYRNGGSEKASKFFEDGFEQVFTKAREHAYYDFPITVFYAFKQAEAQSEGIASTGWSTLLEGMVRAGWVITSTWPIRTETVSRMIAQGTNALASSIVLSLRPRDASAQATNRRGFIAALKAELPQALREMQQGSIAPVDLAQSTIGPGMAVFSRYARVLESDGSEMSVKTALALINQALDEVLAEQDGELDPETRFCIDWYTQYAWDAKPYGEAETLARAKNTSVEGLARGGVLTSKAGKVQLVAPADLDPAWNPLVDDHISLWEATCHLARSYAQDGGETTARLLSAVGQRVDLDAVQLLAYRLYEISQDRRPQDALLFNGLGTSWADLTQAARRVAPVTTQGDFDFTNS